MFPEKPETFWTPPDNNSKEPQVPQWQKQSSGTKQQTPKAMEIKIENNNEPPVSWTLGELDKKAMEKS